MSQTLERHAQFRGDPRIASCTMPRASRKGIRLRAVGRKSRMPMVTPRVRLMARSTAPGPRLVPVLLAGSTEKCLQARLAIHWQWRARAVPCYHSGDARRVHYCEVRNADLEPH